MSAPWLLIRLAPPDPDGIRKGGWPQSAEVFMVPSQYNVHGAHEFILEHQPAGDYLLMPCPEGPSDDISYEVRRYRVGLQVTDITDEEQQP